MLLLSIACSSAPVARVSSELDARSLGDTAGHEPHYRDLLWQAIAKDSYRCLPPANEVFTPPDPSWPTRRIRGQLPHYDWFDGPMQYRIGAAPWGETGSVWVVNVNVAVEPTDADVLELPDCALRQTLGDAVSCSGLPYEQDPGVDACPGSGTFRTSASREHQIELLRRWSRDVDAYYNRDAERYNLPVRYDFEFRLTDEAPAGETDLRIALSSTCGRTPYFVALRSGWSIPILAHEMGHFLGLLDEYEALSGISSLYPKTPFSGSENSRMGLSMKTDTRLYPFHHYLVLRRWHCDPERVEQYGGILRQ